eukprot:GFUD01088148.1.p1 GENE.GFUD01088148.1~~GFUD01088148.1.p1  ORF type:complete len:655 (-),score=157.51 GFUD01088148.1:124-2088(-)
MGNINQKPPGKNGDQETLIDKERSTWDINSHALNIAPGTEDQVQGFKNKSKLFICSKTIQLTRKYDYKHFFVTDKKIVLELVKLYTCGASISQCDYKVQISDFVESDDMVEEEEFKMNKDVRKRMLQVIGPGNFNFSHVFRNSEHIARYVHSGAWISRQMNEDSMTNDSIRRIFDSHMSDDQKKLINTPPKELIVDEEGSMEVIHAELSDHVQYEQQTRLILSEDKEAQNIVFVGPTGCGKSNLVNQLYNKKVVISKASASSVTRKMQFTQGDYKGRKCNIVDTIGLCDTVLSETEVYDLIKDSIRANLVYIDKVAIVCSGRIERAHKEAVKNIMNWLDYEHNKENFVFLYNKSDSDSEDTRQQNLVIMCEEFDISIEQTVNIHSPNGSSLPVKCVQALGLKPGLELAEVASDLTNFRRLLISEPTSRINVNVPITRDKTDISYWYKTDISALLALLKQKDEKENELKKALSQQKKEKEKELKELQSTEALSKHQEEKIKELSITLSKQKDETELWRRKALLLKKKKELVDDFLKQNEEKEKTSSQTGFHPLLLTVSSKGPARDRQGKRMGVYTYTGGEHNGRAMWANSDASQKLFYDSEGHWTIGPNPEENRGGLSTNKSDQLCPPVSGWKYTTKYTTVWTDDPLLTVTAGER